MPEDPKTLAIDSSELLERQRQAAAETADAPRTIAIDSAALAQRHGAAPRQAGTAPERAGAARGWMLLGGILAGLLLAYLVAA